MALAQYGLVLSLDLPFGTILWMMLAVQLARSAAGFILAWRAYHHILADGLTHRL
ncbi:hypothetical protein [Ferrimonas balearica]|uniref:hypothetical protein n=1 Tax=Ferrimonas balearica TaxID=44012 RepID=UPI0002F69755|nr:hypothetical protein [Ferrimonas balearica]